MRKTLDFSSIPVDASAALSPSRIFFMRSTGGFSTTIRILDVTASAGQYPGQLTDDFLRSAEALADKSPEVYTLAKKSWYSFDIPLIDAKTGTLLAELSTTLLKLGVWNITFPSGSSHCDHDIEMKTTGLGSKEYVFAVNSVPFFWDLNGAKAGMLYKTVEGKRIAVGEFKARHGYSKDWVFVVDASNVDEIVALATCAVLLNRSDSFS